MNQINREMRFALRRLAKAVVVITSWHEQLRFAMAATAVSELSLEPPSLLICVNRSASLCPPLMAGAPFAVNILDDTQEHVARLCSSAEKGEARFAHANWAHAEKRVYQSSNKLKQVSSVLIATVSHMARIWCSWATSKRFSSTAKFGRWFIVTSVMERFSRLDHRGYRGSQCDC